MHKGIQQLGLSRTLAADQSMQETGARLVFSNRNDYFPDTRYRAALSSEVQMSQGQISTR